jgi:hypothetical protein
MTSFIPILLICISGADVRECNPYDGSARVVIRGDAEPNELMCGLHGQARLAETAQGQHLAEGETPKVMCERVK